MIVLFASGIVEKSKMVTKIRLLNYVEFSCICKLSDTYGSECNLTTRLQMNKKK